MIPIAIQPSRHPKSSEGHSADANAPACLLTLSHLTRERFERIISDAETCLSVPYCTISFFADCKIPSISSHSIDLKEIADALSDSTSETSEKLLVVVQDTVIDETLAKHALVLGQPKLRFYAAVTLRVNGQALGTFCIADTKPRILSDSETELLQLLGKEIVMELESAGISMLDSASHAYPTQTTSRFDEFLTNVKEHAIPGADFTKLCVQFHSISASGSSLKLEDLQQLHQLNHQVLTPYGVTSGSFGFQNILLAVFSNELNAFAYGYLIKRNVETLLAAGCFENQRIEILCGTITKTNANTVFSIANSYNNLLIHFPLETYPLVRCRLTDVMRGEVTFQNLSSFKLNLGLENILTKPIACASTGEVLIKKIICSREIHSANREFETLKPSEREKLIDYNIAILKHASKLAKTSTRLIAVDILMPSILSSRFGQALAEQIDSGDLLTSNIILCFDGFSLETKHLAVKGFVDFLKSQSISVGLNTFTTVGRHIPLYIFNKLSYCFSYTMMAFDVERYEFDRLVLGIQFKEYSDAGIKIAAMGVESENMRRIVSEAGATHYSLPTPQPALDPDPSLKKG